VGGGYSDFGLSDLALRWFVKKADETGLCFDEKKLEELKPNSEGELRNSYTFKYWLWWPKMRDIFCGKYDTECRYHQVIDESVWERYRMDSNYRPKNLEKYAKEKGFI
jgi:hypothetical protein